MKTKNLDWRWNTIVKAARDEALPQAYFLHFVLAANYPKKGEEIPAIINNLSNASKIKRHG